MSDGNLQIDYQKELNAEQMDVVQDGEGSCLVLAGAGSGKTRTITYRVAYLIERGVAPENILLVTFTNKAAKEMLQRVEMLLGRYPTGLWGGTFHSIANRVLRKYAAQVSRTPNFTILDTEDSKDLIKVCIKELKIDTTARRFPSPAKLYGILSYARNAAKNLREVIEKKHPNFADIIPLIERIGDLYESRKLAADAVDFDDLLLLWRGLLRDNAGVRERLSAQFQYILVDEYQDTNVIQADIIRQLASHHQNVLVVGDDAQSIYSFRAAEIRNILNFPQAFFNTKTFRLTTNYRSTPEILELANSVIAQNQEQFKKELQAVCAGFEKPNVVPAANSAQEAQYIADQILTLRDEGVAMPEMAVLFRAAFHSQALEFELMRRDIPYEYRGGMKFFERAHIKDVIAHLRIVGNCKDESAWLRVLGLQNGVGLVTAGKIFDQLRVCKTIDEVAALDLKLGTKAENGWKNLMATIRKMIAGNRLPGDMIKVAAAGDYRDYLEAEYPDFMERLEDLEQFAIFAEGYDNLVKFLDEVTLTEDYGAVREKAEPLDDERIILSTVHQAKGLEWDTVFVMNLSEGKFPNQRALDEDGGLEEERRLFYVAATRARRHLFLTYPIVAGYDTLAISQPSRFLLELPEELVEQVRLKQPVMQKPSAWEDEEITIVLDDLGEEMSKKKPSPGSFLREISDL
ncbi:ATP-dependent helicase [Patescibacteria group bacterium]|nr:ATP-dependent helicase [Patescibacteria group bacterium]MBU1705372.1 ATP-dependent helicase [Patescibacteria group bacterium]